MPVGGSIGSIRVNLGADTAAFEKAMGRAANEVGRQNDVGFDNRPSCGHRGGFGESFAKQEDALAAVEAAVD